MKNLGVSNFVSIDSIYGKIIVNRFCQFQAETLIKTGKTHIEDELQKILSLVDQLPGNAIIIDGGANIGFFSIPVARQVYERKSKVISFEPQRMLFNALAGSIALNDLDNCFLYNMGLSDAKGKANIPDIDYSKSADFGTISITDIQVDTQPNFIDDKVIQTVSIDEMMLPRLDFIKLDIEGHELQAISGGINTIRQYRPILWVEYQFAGVNNIIDRLRDVPNYNFQIIDPLNMVCIPKENLAAMSIIFN